MKEANLILNTDSYKLSHWKQYPPKTRNISSYIEPRGTGDEIVFFGLQYWIRKYLVNGGITDSMISETQEIAELHGEPFNKEGWEKLKTKYSPKFPIYIQALPEGTVTPRGIPQVQIMNTDPEFYWLTSYLETSLLRSVWYPSSVATLSREIKKNISVWLDLTADTKSALPFMLHDFGARGASSFESANLAGAAHLINFMGTDTLSAIPFIKKWYGYKEFPGFSVPAAEHSTITSWGDTNEIAAYENMIETYGGPGKIYSVVSDSYDYWNAIENIWGETLREKVRNKGGKLVIRPDSGDPAEVVVNSLYILGEKFGYTINKKGYKVLPPEVGVLQGDGINLDSINEILMTAKNKGWSAENIVFGMGGALHSKVNRDTYSYAMKANAIYIEGEGWRSVYKKPKTDSGKNSKAGRQQVIFKNNEYKSVSEESVSLYDGLLMPVYYNTIWENAPDNSWETIRARADI